jgi:DNA repair exonuclease SbcCD ATPase subunit
MKHNPIYSRHRTILLVSVSVISIVLSLAVVSKADDHEEKVKAFQNAINYLQDEQGCRSIPYSDLQDSCQRKQNEVNKLCKESGPWNCEDVDPKRTQEKIERLKTDRDTLKAKKEELESKKSSATDEQQKREIEEQIKKIDDQLYELKRTQGDLEKEVKDSTKMVNDRMYVGKNCRDNRQNVMEVFKDAKSRANGEHDADIEPLAKQLISGWEKREPGHDQAIREVKNGIEKCDKVLYDIGHLGSF